MALSEGVSSVGSGLRESGPPWWALRSFDRDGTRGRVDVAPPRPARLALSCTGERRHGTGIRKCRHSWGRLTGPPRRPTPHTEPAFCAAISVAVEPIRTLLLVLLLVLLLDSTNSGITKGHEMDGYPFW